MTTNKAIKAIEIRPMVLNSGVERILDDVRRAGFNTLFITGKASFGVAVGKSVGGFYHSTKLKRHFLPHQKPTIEGYEDFLSSTLRHAHDRGIEVVYLLPCFIDKDILALGNQSVNREYSLTNRFDVPISSLSIENPLEEDGLRYPASLRDKAMLCPTNDDYRDYLGSIVKEAMELGVNGIRLIYYGFRKHVFCYCSRCKGQFLDYANREFGGLGIRSVFLRQQIRNEAWPLKNRNNRLYELWLEWRRLTVASFARELHDQTVSVNPDAKFFLEYNGQDFVENGYQMARAIYSERQGMDVGLLAPMATSMFWISNQHSDLLASNSDNLELLDQTISQFASVLNRPLLIHFAVSSLDRLNTVRRLIEVLEIENFGVFQPTFIPNDHQILNWIISKTQNPY